MNFINTIAGCLTGRAKRINPPVLTEKSLADHDKAMDERTIASDIVNILRCAEKKGQALEHSLQDTIGEYGWTENIATAILNGLSEVLKKGVPIAQAMKDAVEKAASAAIGFAREHPVYCTILALGVLVILAPWVIQALGFSELGPVEGSFAALWQARYAGYVPKGSLFSYFQRLGMTWKLLPLASKL